MKLNDTFTEVYDKIHDKGHTFSNQWIVKEHNAGATMTQLIVNAEGEFVGYDNTLVKDIKDTTTKMSSTLENKDCDGIAFLHDNEGNENLIFAELKSNFDTGKIAEAFHQIVMSFLKMHAWLSLCNGYDLENIQIHFIVACKYFKNRDQKSRIMKTISEAQQLEENTFNSRILSRLLTSPNKATIKLSKLKDIQKLPYHQSICNKEVTMYLQMTILPTDANTTLTL